MHFLPNKKSIFEWLKAILISFVCVLFFRSCCFEISTVNSPSMEKTLLTGDYILINKLSYGPRLAKTLLSFPFINQHYFSTAITLPYMRLFGSPDIERNDIVVFNYPLEEEFPIDHRTYFVKRCVAIAGDSLQIINGTVFVNGKIIDSSTELQYNYHVKSTTKLDSVFIAKYKLYEGGTISDNGDYSFTLTKKLANTLKLDSAIKLIEINNEDKNTWDEFVFPFNEYYKWNVDNYGAIKIPAKGDTVTLNTTTICLYEKIITKYQGDSLQIKHDSVFVNNKYTTRYLITQNYYFMMGDNRHNSQDSRHWGFVPEDHIIGKVTRVVFSKDMFFEKTIRWNRFLKAIN